MLEKVNSISKIIRVYVYMRYSSDMQTENSIEGQRRVIEEYAKKMGICIVNEYIDRGKSGRHDKRENFLAMINRVTNGNPDGVVGILVYKLDRFFRDEKLHRKYEDLINEHNVCLISATEDINEIDFSSKLMKYVTVLLNERESMKISENVTRGKNEIAYKCKWGGGTPPLGYDVDKVTQKLIINEKEAKIVRFAYKLRGAEYSYREICDKLNQRNYKTKRGNSFVKNSLTELFRNIKYKGVYEYNRAVAKGHNGKFNRHASKPDDEIIRIEGGCPQIVSPKLWDKVYKMGKTTGAKGKYLFSGMVRCANCGAVMQVNKRNNHNKTYISFFCPNSKKKNNCNMREINLMQLEDYVVRKLCSRILSNKILGQFIDKYSELNDNSVRKIKQKIRNMNTTISANNTKIVNLVTQMEDGCDKTTADILHKRINELEKNNAINRRKIEVLENYSKDIPDIDTLKKSRKVLYASLICKENMVITRNLIQSIIVDIFVSDNDVIVIMDL